MRVGIGVVCFLCCYFPLLLVALRVFYHDDGHVSAEMHSYLTLNPKP